MIKSVFLGCRRISPSFSDAPTASYVAPPSRVSRCMPLSPVKKTMLGSAGDLIMEVMTWSVSEGWNCQLSFWMRGIWFTHVLPPSPLRYSDLPTD